VNDEFRELVTSCHFHVIIVTPALIVILPHVVGAQLYRLSTVDAHTDVLQPIHGKII